MLLGPCLVCPAIGIRMAALLILLWSLAASAAAHSIPLSLLTLLIKTSGVSLSLSLSLSPMVQQRCSVVRRSHPPRGGREQTK